MRPRIASTPVWIGSHAFLPAAPRDRPPQVQSNRLRSTNPVLSVVANSSDSQSPKTAPMSIQPLLKVAEVARITNHSEKTIRRLIKAKRIKVVRISSRILIEPQEVERLIDESRS